MNDRNISVYLSENNIGLLRDALALLGAADTGVVADCAWLDGYLAEHADEYRTDKADANLSILLARAADGDTFAQAEVSKRRELTAAATEAVRRLAAQAAQRMIRPTPADVPTAHKPEIA